MTRSNIQVRKSENKLTVKLNEPVNIQQINNIYNELKKIDFDKPEIEFEFSQNSTFDLSFIQILVSLRKTSLNSKQKITLKSALDEIQKSVILNSINDIKIAI